MKLSSTPIRYLVVIAMVTMFAALAHAEYNQGWEEHDATLVGRITHLEGTLSRYDTDQEDWVPTSADAPIVDDDRLESAIDTKAEVILPNNIWIRMDAETEIQMVSLDHNATEIDIPYGTARLYNKSSEAQIKATTPFGHIVTPAGAGADIYVYDDGVEIIALKKKVYFTHISSYRQHEVLAGAGSIFADTRQMSADRGDGSPEWSKWNKEMDALWAMRAQTKGESTTYLPPALHNDAYALDTHGRWERVYYEGSYYRFWRPVHIHASWTPFSSGIWRVRWGDHIWIPHEPFGYVTHHYGNWVYTNSHWYWAPPVTRVMIRAGLPLFHIGFSWYPGRVAWIHSSAHIGWFPLAPYEPYYSHRHWGRRSIVVAHGRHYRPKRQAYRHRRHATVIHRSHLYRDRNYRAARVRNVSRTQMADQFRTAPVLNKKIVKNDRTVRDKRRLDRDARLHHPKRTHRERSRPDRWTSGKRAHRQHLTDRTKITQPRSGATKDRAKRTPRFSAPRSMKPGKQIQPREGRKTLSRDQRQNRKRASIAKKRLSPRANTQLKNKTTQRTTHREVFKPKANRRQQIEKKRRATKGGHQRVQSKKRSSHRVEPKRAAQGKREHRVQKRPDQQLKQGKAYQTRRYLSQKKQHSRGASRRSDGRRGSRPGR